MSITKILTNRYSIALFLRLFITITLEILERQGIIAYEDIDYLVFTDGARHVLKNESPYLRETYRYSPIMAYISIPNLLLFRIFGKVFSCACDVLSALLLEMLLFSQEKENQNPKYIKENPFTLNSIINIVASNKYRIASLIKLFNPLDISICIRGSSDSFTVVCILLVVLLVERNIYALSGIIFGFIIHFRIYPIIYSLSLFFYILEKEIGIKNNHRQVISEKNLINVDSSTSEKAYLKESDNKYFSNSEYIKKSFFRKSYNSVKALIKTVFNFNNLHKMFMKVLRLLISIFTHTNHWVFTIMTIFVFVGLNVLFHYLYPEDFLEEALLYHFKRKDHRHNFSIYFNMIYLTYNTSLANLLSKLAFLPQALLILIFSCVFSSKNINFCLVIITMIFVHFNKVITAQYFLWYYSLLPILYYSNNLFKMKKGLIILVLWWAVELSWSYFSHQIEYQGKNEFLGMFVVNALFFSVSLFGIKELIVEQQLNE